MQFDNFITVGYEQPVSYLWRQQLITQSADGTAYKPHFVKEADLKKRSWNTCLVHWMSSLGVAYSLCRLPLKSVSSAGQNVFVFQLWRLLSAIKCEL